MITALASVLYERGVDDRLATLAAWLGLAALAHTFASWLDELGDLDELSCVLSAKCTISPHWVRSVLRVRQ